MKAVSCSNCRHSSARERQTDARGAIDLSQPQIYECRRYPPRFVQPITPQGIGMPTPLWPKMLDEHWCGEHEATNAAN
jgi:hypothetical protein